MNRYAFILMAFTATCLSCFAGETEFSCNQKSWETRFKDVTVVQLATLSESNLREIMEGKHPELAIEIKAYLFIVFSFIYYNCSIYG